MILQLEKLMIVKINRENSSILEIDCIPLSINQFSYGVFLFNLKSEQKNIEAHLALLDLVYAHGKPKEKLTIQNNGLIFNITLIRSMPTFSLKILDELLPDYNILTIQFEIDKQG